MLLVIMDGRLSVDRAYVAIGCCRPTLGVGRIRSADGDDAGNAEARFEREKLVCSLGMAGRKL